MTLLRGLKTFEVDIGEAAGARGRLMHLAPGLTFPQHSHRSQERVLVLEGAYADAHRTQVHAGETQTMPPGSEHQLHILGTTPCVAAIVERGIDFTGPVLRWVNRLRP